MNNPLEVEDHTRVDAFMAARRKAMIMSQLWKPALAGAIGATLIVAAVYVTLPKFTTREIIVDHVIIQDKPFTNYVPQDKPFDNYTPKEIAPPIPVPATPPIAAAPPAPLPPLAPPYAAKTPEEKPFVDSPEYRGAIYRGRIVRSKDGKAIYFEDGKYFIAAHWDPDTHEVVGDPDIAIDSDPYIGDLAMCLEEKDHANLWDCTAMHHGKEVLIPNKSNTTNAPAVGNQPI
jgi:hypothetical protein